MAHMNKVFVKENEKTKIKIYKTTTKNTTTNTNKKQQINIKKSLHKLYNDSNNKHKKTPKINQRITTTYPNSSVYWKTSRTIFILAALINNVSTILARRLHQESNTLTLLQYQNQQKSILENNIIINNNIDNNNNNNNNNNNTSLSLESNKIINKHDHDNFINVKINDNHNFVINDNDLINSTLLFDNNDISNNNSLYENNQNESLRNINSTLEEPLSDFILMGVTSVVLGIMILITVIGNVFVIAAILLERNLQNVANYLIVSLAVADLMVACLVMPLGAVYEISRGWILGPELCDMWTSSDVLCCTASILHLVAIAVDRYWAVTNVDYIHTRNGSRIVTMIVVVWSVALVVSLAPQFGWKDPDYLDRINLQQRCLVSQDIGYQIFATCSTFYVPLLVILVLYWKIFQTARKRIRRRRQQRNAVLETTKVNLAPATGSPPNTSASKTNKSLHFLTKNRFMKMRRCKNKNDDHQQQASLALIEGQSQSQSTTDILQDDENNQQENQNDIVKQNDNTEKEPILDTQTTTAFTITSNHKINTPIDLSPDNSSCGATAATTNNCSTEQQSHCCNSTTNTTTTISTVQHIKSPTTPQQTISQQVDKQPTHQPTKRDLKKESLEAKRERKAAKTLAIITGAFVVCWLPFFIMALLMPLCEACYISDYLSSFFLWLGYFNSTLNPVIYTIFSPEFRQAFKRMLCGVSHNRNRGRKLR